MPYDDPDPTDPMTLNAVVLETDDAGAMREMAVCFAEEYFRLGFDADRILRMFQTRGYAGPYLAWRSLGEKAVRTLIEELAILWPQNCCQTLGRNDAGEIALPVLDHATIE